MDWECPGCNAHNESEFPFGADVRCSECGLWWETDSEYGWESMCAWVTGAPGNQEG